MADKSLTIKQTKFVKEYVANDGNGTQAALQTYNTTDYQTAAAISSENLNKPEIKSAIELALEKHQITMDAAVQPIADGLIAKRVQITKSGDETLFDEVADHSVRLKASAMALKLLGADKGDATPGAGTIIFAKTANFSSKDYMK